jgi:thioesterase domain-containing protein
MNPYMARNRHLIVHGDGDRRPLIWIQPGLQQAEVIEKLGPDQPVYCVARPTLDRTKPPLSFDEISSYHIETIRGLCPEGPYALTANYGHAAIAFEIASRLLREGGLISVLILINPVDPAISATPVVPEPRRFRLRLTFHRILFHLQKIKDQGAKDELAYWRQRIRATKARKKNASDRPPETTSDTSSIPPLPKFGNVAHADAYALRNHVLQAFKGAAIIIRPTKAPRHAYDYPNLRWTALFEDGLDVQQVPGDSTSMWSGENASALARKLRGLCDSGHDSVLDELQKANCERRPSHRESSKARIGGMRE